MVFQNYALYPHMTVDEEHRVRAQAARRPEGRDQAAGRRDEPRSSASRTCSTASPGSSPAASGSASRWAGRSCASRRRFLMDEPLSNLDAKLRVSMRAELERLHERLRTTTVYVTHDQVEAMTLGDRVAVMKDGVIQQIDRPSDLFTVRRTASSRASSARPPMNFVRGRVGDGAISFADFSLPLPNDRAADAARRPGGRSSGSARRSSRTTRSRAPTCRGSRSRSRSSRSSARRRS